MNDTIKVTVLPDDTEDANQKKSDEYSKDELDEI